MSIFFARYLRKNLTDAERKLWQRLRRRQLYGCKFRHQASIGPYIVDFLCVEGRLNVEVDGGQHDLEKEADQRRTADLEARGSRVIRVWNNEALQNTDGVVQYILQFLSAGHSPP